MKNRFTNIVSSFSLGIAALALAVGCESSPPAAPAPTCLGSSMLCGATCADLKSDNDNCGACGTACGASSVCSAGKCVATDPHICPQGTTECTAGCVDTSVDPENCGACGVACSVAEACEGGTCGARVWEQVGSIGAPGFSDYSTQGTNYLFSLSGTTFDQFVFPAAEQLTGTVTPYAAPPISMPATQGLAFVESRLFQVSGTSVYMYSFANNAWTTPLTGLAHAFTASQATHDNSGIVYERSTDLNIVAYDTVANSATYTVVPSALGTSSPRIAYDSKSKLLLLANLGSQILYTLDPATATFTDKTGFPDVSGINQAFCADRNDHLFTAAYNSNDAQVWRYTISSDTWEQIASLPRVHSASDTCTVSADGYLYWGDANVSTLYRLKL